MWAAGVFTPGCMSHVSKSNMVLSGQVLQDKAERKKLEVMQREREREKERERARESERGEKDRKVM